jgi:hypothetical protein
VFVFELSVHKHANARVLGSHQLDAMQNITGNTVVRGTNSDALLGPSSGALFDIGESSTRVRAETGSYGEGSARALYLDTSRVARTSSETRSSNTALAPRIIAF